MSEWNSIEPGNLPPNFQEVILSVKWMDVPCIAYHTTYGWVSDMSYVEGDGLTSDIRESDVEGWMPIPKPKWKIKRDAED